VGRFPYEVRRKRPRKYFLNYSGLIINRVLIIRVFGPDETSTGETPILKLSELTLFSSYVQNGQKNIAPKMGVEASYNNPSWPPENAIDEDINTFWACPNPILEYIKLTSDR